MIGPHDYRGSEMGDLILDWLRKKLHFLVKGAYDFVDVRDVAHGHILAGEQGRKGEVYILSGRQVKVLELKRLVQSVLGKKIVSIITPMWLAKIAAKVTPFYYRLMKKRPQFTDYSLETLQSNSDVCCGKAKRELGYNPRSMAATIKDTVTWLMRRKERADIQ